MVNPPLSPTKLSVIQIQQTWSCLNNIHAPPKLFPQNFKSKAPSRMMESPGGALHDHRQSQMKLGQDPKSDSAPQTNNVEITNDRSSSRTTQVPSSSSTVSRSKKSVRWSQDLVEERTLPPAVGEDDEASNPYVAYSGSPSNSSFNIKSSVVNVKDVLGRWGKKVGEATRKAEDLAGNTWQHLKTAPSLTDAALGRIAQGTKVLAEGGYEKIFRQTFDTVPEELLQNSYACYLSTSAGPVIGVLYVSTAKLAFCSDNPLSYKVDNKTEWSYYKVVIPLNQLKAVNPSCSRANSAEKYIQVISVDNHEFWYMGFLNYQGALKCLQESLQTRVSHSV